jgi:hypothetical protein
MKAPYLVTQPMVLIFVKHTKSSTKSKVKKTSEVLQASPLNFAKASFHGENSYAETALDQAV